MKKKRKILKHAIVIIICLIFCVGCFGFVIFSPSIQLYKDYDTDISKVGNISQTLKIYNKNGKLELSPYNNGEYVKIDSLPIWAQDAFVSIEDKRFYTHNGVDYVRIFGAFIENIKSAKFKEGASTITQQLVKNTLLHGDKTIERKIKEIKLAQKVEREYSKKEILEKYLNVIYFGSNVYGIGNASKVYFNKDANLLTLSQSALLAGIINNPTLYNPYKNPKNALKRRNYILKVMKNRGCITEKEYESAVNEPLNLARGYANDNQYYNNVINLIKEKKSDVNVAVTTPMDKDLSENVKEIINAQAPNYNVNVIVASNDSGNVLANVSTFSYDVSKARFLPGSVIKPILCYAPLLENKDVYPISQVNDAPYSINDYAPSNFNNNYRGQISQSEALAYSSNSVALQNLEKIGISNAISFAEKTGLRFSGNDKKNFAIALGGLERGFTLNELLTSFMCIARNGKKIAPSYVSCIDKHNKAVYVNHSQEERVMKEETAFLLSQMMRDCAQYGTAKTLKRYKNVRAKTGTVGDKNGNRECYCVAFSPAYTVLCHISKDDGLLPLDIMGGTLPAKIVDKVFTKLNDESEFTIPPSVVKKDVLADELERGNVVLAPLYEPEKNKKSCWFSKENLPEYQYNSYDDFIEKYELSYFYDFDIFDSFVD